MSSRPFFFRMDGKGVFLTELGSSPLHPRGGIHRQVATCLAWFKFPGAPVTCRNVSNSRSYWQMSSRRLGHGDFKTLGN